MANSKPEFQSECSLRVNSIGLKQAGAVPTIATDDFSIFVGGVGLGFCRDLFGFGGVHSPGVAE